MKKLFKPLVLLICAGMIIACEKENDVITPDPDIVNAFADFEVTKGDDPFTYEFKNLSKQYSRLEWRFGDDTLSTSETPSHVYYTTGIFTVDLRAISATGTVSRKIADIKILPSDILKITTAAGTGTNKLKFDVTSDATFTNLEWKLVDKFRPTTVTTTSKEKSPEFTLTPGTLTELTLNGTTVKGSSVTLVNNASTAGIVTDITNTIIKKTPSRDNTSNANETSAKLFDKANTKIYLGDWGTIKNWQVVMDLAFPQIVTYYGIGNGNDSPDRDPKSWQLEGSNDNGATWTIVDQRTMTRHFTDQLIDRGFQNNDANVDWKNFYFQVANPKLFSSYRLNITENWGSTGFQFGEIILFR